MALDLVSRCAAYVIHVLPMEEAVDDKETFMELMWHTFKPYNQADDGKWKSYIVSPSEASLLETEADCVTLVKSEQGIYIQ